MRHYIRLVLLVVVALVAAAAVLTVAVDPYDVFNAPKAAGFNLYKPKLGNHLAIAKSRQLLRTRPTTIVAGNSRVEVGVDPDDPSWPAVFRPIYNFGLPGYSAATVWSRLRPILERSAPKRLIFAVDFVDFRIDAATWAKDRTIPGPENCCQLGAGDLTRMALSLAALEDALATIAGQYVDNPATTTPQGFNGLAEYRDLVASEGHHTLFAQRNLENLRDYLSGPKQVAWREPGGNPGFSALRDLVSYCQTHAVDLTIVTYPYHADILTSFEEAGLWPAFEDWKRRLAELADRTGVPVWDFSIYNQLTIEPVPPAGDTSSHMNWYWEAGHFKATLGSVMIERFAGGEAQFGARLSAATIDGHLARIAADARSYRLAHRAAVNRIATLAKAAGSR